MSCPRRYTSAHPSSEARTRTSPTPNGSSPNSTAPPATAAARRTSPTIDERGEVRARQVGGAARRGGGTLRAAASALTRAVREGQGPSARRRSDELDDALGLTLPGLRGGAAGPYFTDVDG